MADFRQENVDMVVKWLLSKVSGMNRERFVHPETNQEASWLISQVRDTKTTHVVVTTYVCPSYPLKNPILLASSFNGSMRRIGKNSIVTTSSIWDDKHKRVVITWIPGRKESA